MRCGSLASLTTTANSSPPSRPHSSLSLITLRSRSETRVSSRSPMGWPSVSLTALKRSRSIIIKPQRVRQRSASAIASPSVSFTNIRLGKPVSVSKRAIRLILSALRYASVTSEPTPLNPTKLPLSSKRGEAESSHQCVCPPIWTGRIRSLKLSRFFNFSERSRRLAEKLPASHASPARIWSNGLVSSACGSTPRDAAKRGETWVRQRDASVCHIQSPPESSYSRSNKLTTSLFS